MPEFELKIEPSDFINFYNGDEIEEARIRVPQYLKNYSLKQSVQITEHYPVNQKIPFFRSKQPLHWPLPKVHKNIRRTRIPLPPAPKKAPSLPSEPDLDMSALNSHLGYEKSNKSSSSSSPVHPSIIESFKRLGLKSSLKNLPKFAAKNVPKSNSKLYLI